MSYLLFALALIVGIVNGAPLSGFLLGAALCYTVHTAQKAQRESGGTQALRQEIQDLRRRVRLLEAQIRPSENPSADVCEPPQAENGGVQKRYPRMPETGTAFSPQTEMSENETPPSPALPPRHARADVSALARLRAQRQDGTMHGAPTQAAAARVQAQTAQTAFQTASQAQRPSENETADQAAWYDNNALASWFVRSNPLLKTGVVVLFLGLAFLLRYASERVHVPVGLRYLTVAGAGLAAALAGWKLQARRRDYALVLQGFGLAVMYLTALAALKLHPLLPAPLVFALMVLLVAVMAASAVKQNAQAMAQVALVGGLAAPLLVSDGSGRYLVLFSYLALLNGGVAFIAWFKAWRPLNLTGFAGTFLIAAAWGARDYAPDLFATTEPFLLYHGLLYTLVAVFFARRRLWENEEDDVPLLADNASFGEIVERIAAHGIRVHLLDHVLLFGTAGAAFTLQWHMVKHWPHGAGWSALGFAAAYACAALTVQGGGLALLRQAFAALALAFATLAVPLFFDGADTASLWTLEAALTYYFGLRGRLPHLRLAALAVYLLAAAAQLASYRLFPTVSDGLIAGSPLSTLLAAGGGGLVYLLWALYRREGSAAWERGWQTVTLAAALFYASLLPLLWFSSSKTLLLSYALLSLLWAACQYRQRQTVFAVFSLLCALMMSLFYLGKPFCCSLFVFPGSKLQGPSLTAAAAVRYLFAAALTAAAARLLSQPQWRAREQTSWSGATVFVVALLLADAAWRSLFGSSGNIERWLHPLLLLTPFAAAARYLRWREAQYVLLAPAFFFAAALLTENFRAAPLVAWPILAAQTALTFWLLGLADEEGAENAEENGRRGVFFYLHAAALFLFALLWQKLVFQTASLFLSGAWLQLSWLAVPAAYWLAAEQDALPLFRRHPAVYRGFGRGLCAFAAAAWLLWVNTAAPHRPAPLPYLPLFNPMELAAVGLLWFGFRTLPHGAWSGEVRRFAAYALSALAFFTLSAGVMRLWHFYGGIGWNLAELLRSVGLQASLSVVWAGAAIVLMVAGNRSGSRGRWIGGASLMGMVVVKLFLVELGNSGGIERIASFIIVGLLLLLVGWFAPVPPKDKH